MRSRISSSVKRMARSGLLNSEFTSAEKCAEEVATVSPSILCNLWMQNLLLSCVVGHTMQALPSGQMINKPIKLFLCVIALTVLAVPVFRQGTAIQPCPPTPAPAKPATTPRARLLTVDSSIPDDPEVLKIIAPYEEKVRELSKVIGRLDGGLSKTGVGGGTL